jgi:RNA-binding protein YlmH
MDKGKLLDRVGAAGDERLVLARVLDKLEQARNRSVPAYTDFLSPAEQQRARDVLRLAGAGETDFTDLGGYPEAERKILLFLPDWLAPEDAPSQSPLRCLRAAFRPEYALTHRDFLGSLMGLGIVREKVGDLLVGETSCDLVALESVTEFLAQNWTQAGRAPLQVKIIAPEELQVPQAKCQEIRDTVSSLRLDAVTSTALRMARGKAAELIESGRVQLNWRECVKSDQTVRQGDVVTARGFGKFELAEVGGVTKKGRTSIVVRRYL